MHKKCGQLRVEYTANLARLSLLSHAVSGMKVLLTYGSIGKALQELMT